MGSQSQTWLNDWTTTSGPQALDLEVGGTCYRAPFFWGGGEIADCLPLSKHFVSPPPKKKTLDRLCFPVHHRLKFAQTQVHWVCDAILPSDHLILCHPLLLLPSIFPSIRVFSNEYIVYIYIQWVYCVYIPMYTQWGEGNGTPLQYSCLENPMDGGAWWAAVCGVSKSQIRQSDFHFHFSLSCIGEGNGNPLQCSCLENPRDGGAWWAAVYGVAQSRIQLKQLSSSSSSIHNEYMCLYIYNEYIVYTY